MDFNPIFLHEQTPDNGTAKSIKLKNTSYLFSDIIKVFINNDASIQNPQEIFIFSLPVDTMNLNTSSVESGNLFEMDSSLQVKNLMNSLEEILNSLNELSETDEKIPEINAGKFLNEFEISGKNLNAFIQNLLSFINSNNLSVTDVNDKIINENNSKLTRDELVSLINTNNEIKISSAKSEFNAVIKIVSQKIENQKTDSNQKLISPDSPVQNNQGITNSTEEITQNEQVKEDKTPLNSAKNIQFEKDEAENIHNYGEKNSAKDKPAENGKVINKDLPVVENSGKSKTAVKENYIESKQILNTKSANENIKIKPEENSVKNNQVFSEKENEVLKEVKTELSKGINKEEAVPNDEVKKVSGKSVSKEISGQNYIKTESNLSAKEKIIEHESEKKPVINNIKPEEKPEKNDLFFGLKKLESELHSEKSKLINTEKPEVFKVTVEVHQKEADKTSKDPTNIFKENRMIFSKDDVKTELNNSGNNDLMQKNESEKAQNIIENKNDLKIEKADLKSAEQIDTKQVLNEKNLTNNERISFNRNISNDPHLSFRERMEAYTNLKENIKVIKSSNLINEITEYLNQGEKKIVTLKLMPENFGKVNITIDIVEKSLNAQVEVENESIKQVVQSNIEYLRQSLNSNGLVLNNFNISLNTNEQKPNKPFEQQKKKSGGGSKDNSKNINDFSQPVTKHLGYNTYEFLV